MRKSHVWNKTTDNAIWIGKYDNVTRIIPKRHSDEILGQIKRHHVEAASAVVVMRTTLEQPDNRTITAVPVESRLTEKQGRFY